MRMFFHLWNIEYRSQYLPKTISDTPVYCSIMPMISVQLTRYDLQVDLSTIENSSLLSHLSTAEVKNYHNSISSTSDHRRNMLMLAVHLLGRTSYWLVYFQRFHTLYGNSAIMTSQTAYCIIVLLQSKGPQCLFSCMCTQSITAWVLAGRANIIVSEPDDDAIVGLIFLIHCVLSNWALYGSSLHFKSWTWQFFSKNVSQGSVAAHLTCGRILISLVQIYCCIYYYWKNF